MNPNPINQMTRRQFFTTTVAGAAGVATLVRGETPAAKAHLFPEPARDMPLVSDADVIVCGAGPAGVTAAITAARAGAKVRLFEARLARRRVDLVAAGLLARFRQARLQCGTRAALRERDAINGGGMNGFCYEPEEMKLLLEELCAAAGVKVQFHTRVAAAYREGRSLTTIVTESKIGRQAWRAPVFIDTTGDGDLGSQAGCEFEIGREKGCPCQPMTMYALLVVKDVTQIADCIHGRETTVATSAPRRFRTR